MRDTNLEEQPDRLDKLLFKLPDEPAPTDLAARIYANILAHHRRHVTIRFGVSAILAVSGIWLALPGFAEMLQSLALPNSGWALVTALIEMAEAGAARMSTQFLSAVTAYQASLTNPISGVVWIGMIALAAGCLLALEQILPHGEA